MTTLLPLLLTACAGLELAPGDAIEVASVAYQLDWDRTGAQQTADGWAITTDLGYRVFLEAGTVVTYHATLAPCEETTVASRLLGLALGAPAWADHAVVDDPSLVLASAAEDLVAGQALVLDPGTIETAEYCGFNWLLARGDEGTVYEGTTLALQAVWQAPDGAWGELAVQTDWADGRLLDWVDLDTTGLEPNDAPYDLELVVERDLGRLFDEIDLATATDNEVPWALLENLLDHARVEVRPR